MATSPPHYANTHSDFIPGVSSDNSHAGQPASHHYLCFPKYFCCDKIFFVSTKYFYNFVLNFRRACTHDPHGLHMRGRAAADPVRGGGRHPDRASQLRPLQHRHLQRRRQDPLERQLHVPQDKTHPPEQVSIFLSLQHKLKSEYFMIMIQSVTRCQRWVNNIQKHPLDHLWLSSCCHLLYNYKGETKVAIICALLLTSPGEMWTVVSRGGTISVTLDTASNCNLISINRIEILEQRNLSNVNTERAGPGPCHQRPLVERSINVGCKPYKWLLQNDTQQFPLENFSFAVCI